MNILRLKPIIYGAMMSVLFFCLNPLNAQQWQQTKGPEWGRIYSVVDNGENVLMACNSGIYKTVNAGSSWEKMDIGSAYLGVNTLVKDGGKLYAATSGSGMLVSTDDGLNWSTSNSGLGNLSVNTFYINGANFYAGTAAGLFVSTNNGSSWSALNNGLDVPIYTILSFDSKLYVGTSDGVYLSTDNGATWLASTSGIGAQYIYAITSLGSDIYVAAGINLYKSTNNGSSWIVVNTSSYATCFYQNDGKLYAGGSSGISYTSDNGANWNSLGFIANVMDIKKIGNTLYVGTWRGIYKSNDNGVNWIDINKDIYSSFIDLVYAPKDGLLMAGENVGYTYASDNYGWSWLGKQSVGTFNIFGQNLYTFSSNGNRLFAGTGNGVKISDNNGETWYGSNTGILQYFVNSEYANIKAITVTDNSILVGTSAGGIYSGNGVYMSSDNGASWSTSNIGGLDGKDVNSLISEGNIVLAGTYKNALYYSTDKGFTWTQKTNGIGSTFFGGYYTINTLAISGTNFLAGSQAGLYISKDNADSWTKVVGTLASENILSLLTVKDSVYAVCSQGVFKSIDQGLTWNIMNDGLINTSVRSLASDKYCLYAATSGAGVWRYPYGDFAMGINKPNSIKNQISLYPNPVSKGGSIFIKSNLENVKSIEVYNNSGMTLKNISFNSSGNEISADLSELRSGLYFIRISNEAEDEVHKVIVE